MLIMSVKVKFTLEQAMKAHKRNSGIASILLTSALDEVGLSVPHPARFTPGWSPGPIVTGTETFALAGI